MPRLPKSAEKLIPESLRGSLPKKKSKYRNEWTEVDGKKFQSKREAKRYSELALLEKLGKISDLKTQVDYQIHVAGWLVTTYRADFVYKQLNANGWVETVVEDAKGYRAGEAYKLFKLKKELMRLVHGINVIEV